MNMAAHDRPGVPAAPSAAPANPGRPQGDPATPPRPRPGLLTRLSSQFGSRGLTRRGPALDDAARRELLLHGADGVATILSVRSSTKGRSPAAGTPETPAPDHSPAFGHEFWVRIQRDGRHPYETRVRQRVAPADLEWMQPGEVIACRVDPGDRDRVVLYVPSPDESTRTSITKILTDGRRARATVLAATPVAADYTGRDDPVLRLDLELQAWDEPSPWRVRIVQPVPLSALELVDLGRHLEAAFFTVDRGESVAIDWTASRKN
ncbi:hypothetical protein [Nocardia huaxiensis]|uniref:hypothetical protein n=1 Tax=Nocardia huaxiensis TaxID=2755382 RepID=UPI001E472F98|nr:hypothetical protein [Nocardia huaxiensis]UFS95219.1 hypothetical protein LPY97_31730 [Nocardia huaxiensis]